MQRDEVIFLRIRLGGFLIRSQERECVHKDRFNLEDWVHAKKFCNKTVKGKTKFLQFEVSKYRRSSRSPEESVVFNSMQGKSIWSLKNYTSSLS